MPDQINENKKLIFVIDDDPVMQLSCLKILEKLGMAVETYGNGEEGLTRIKEKKPDLIVVDLKMPKIGGIDVIEKVQKIDPDISIIVITGYATVETAVEAMKTGAYDFLPKPFTSDELRLMVKRGLERTELLNQTRKLTEEKEELKRRFVTFVSHQLKSPLAAVQQYLDVLKHLEPTPEKQKLQDEWIERALIRIKEMRTIISDWLTLSKIECKKFPKEGFHSAVLPIVQDIFKSIEEESNIKNINLISELPEDLSDVKCSNEYLLMVLSNLISNAIKYNKPNGLVKVTAEEENSNLHISVSDTGYGIPEDKIEMIFEEFYRIKDDKIKDISGSGLGLAISKKIVDELGGSIQVQSKEEQGTTFTVTLPKSNGCQTNKDNQQKQTK